METEKIEKNQAPETTPAVGAQQSIVEIMLSKYHPDKTFEEGEDREGFIMEDYENLKSKLSALEADDQKLSEIVAENPEFALLIGELLKGAPLRVAIAKAGIELPEPQQGDADFEDYSTAMTERKQKKADLEKRREQLKANQMESEPIVAQFFEDKGLDDKQAKAFEDFVDNSISDIYENKFSKDLLERFYKAFTYDEDVDSAKQAGEVEGRNANITAKREKAAKSTDGLPSDTGATQSNEPPQRKSYIDRLLSNK